MNTEIIKKRLGKVLPYIVFLFTMVFTLSLKANFHIDEVWTYGLSNNIGGVEPYIEDGVTYDWEDNPIHKFTTVQVGERLEFKNVWENQEKDVHPPLYYVLVHFISSLTPNHFSLWQAGVVNIVFGELALYIFIKFCRLFSDKKLLIGIMTYMFIFSAGILSNIAFLRMYVMSMFWIILQSYAALKIVKGDKRKRSFLSLFAASYGGAITHYYCVVFTVGMATGCALYLLAKRDWKTFWKYVLIMILSAGAALLTFPSMLTHVFSGSRGTEAINNLKSSGGYIERIGNFARLINTEVFGGYLWVIVLILIGLSCIFWKKVRLTGSYVILAFATLVYFLFVVKVAPYQTNRYIFSIYPLLMVLFLIPLLGWLDGIKGEQLPVMGMIIFASLITGSTWTSASWDVLFTETKPLLQAAESYSDADCIYVYDERWQTIQALDELSKYKTVTFVRPTDLELLKSLPVADSDQIVLKVASFKDPDWHAAEYAEKYLGKRVKQKLGQRDYSASYLLGEE